MKCRDCLIWNNRNGDLIAQREELVPAYIRIGITDKELIGYEAKMLRLRWGQYISVMDTECPTGRCILCNLPVIV